MVDVAGDEVLVLVAEVVAEDATVGERRLAARAACVTGTWMPSDGRERDLRRVLYGMAAEVRLASGTRPSLCLASYYSVQAGIDVSVQAGRNTTTIQYRSDGNGDDGRRKWQCLGSGRRRRGFGDGGQEGGQDGGGVRRMF